jgi:serine protease inhibitor ecotin
MKNLNQLGVTLEELYLAENKQVNVHLSDKPYVFSLVLKGRDNDVDCNLSSFGANLYARTIKGVNRQKYQSLATKN